MRTVNEVTNTDSDVSGSPALSSADHSGTFITPEVVKSFCEGDHHAFETIYLHYVDSLSKFMVKLLGSYEDGEEVTQKVFIKLWENRSKVDPGRNIKSYLFTIAKNAALDHIKKRVPSYDISDREWEADKNYVADQTLIAHETKLLIDIAINNMPRNRKEVFKLYEEGLSYNEIAERLHISVDNAQQHISRARKDIKELIGLIALFLSL